MLRIINLTVLFLLTLISCSEQPSLIRHWYLQESTSKNSSYVELIFDRDSVNIYKNGWNWAKVPYQKQETLISVLNQNIKIVANNKKSLILRNENGTIEKYQATPLNESLDANRLRKFQYDIKKTSLQDSIQIQELKNNLWIFMGGAYDTLYLEKNIHIEKAK